MPDDRPALPFDLQLLCKEEGVVLWAQAVALFEERGGIECLGDVFRRFAASAQGAVVDEIQF